MFANKLPRFRSIILVVYVAALLVSAGWVVKTATATPPSGLTATPLAAGALPEPIRLKLRDDRSGFGAGTSVSQIVMVKFTLESGGTFGWHQHGGPVWAIVAAGMLTLYDGDDLACQPHVYAAGSSLLDEGTHTHIARNEGSVPVEIYATFMLPAGGQPRIDVPTPGNCPF
jgi:quercetin dioxygenase-like cupin family protein